MQKLVSVRVRTVVIAVAFQKQFKNAILMVTALGHENAASMDATAIAHSQKLPQVRTRQVDVPPSHDPQTLALTRWL